MWQIKIMKNQSNAGDIMQEWVFFLKENRPHTKAIMIWLGGGNVSKLVQVGSTLKKKKLHIIVISQKED